MTKQPRLFTTATTRPRGRVTDGLETTLSALKAGGRLEAVDAGIIGLAREAFAQYQVASRDPDVSEYVRTTMGRFALDTWKALPVRHSDDDGPTTLADLFAALGDTADTRPAD